MASSLEFVEYVCELLKGAGDISYKKMFGEYGLYCHGKIFGLVCDNQFYVKPTIAGKEALCEPELAPPYKGAKDYFLISELEDRNMLAALVVETCGELPEPKPKKPKGQQKKS